MNEQSVYALLGLCHKASGLVSGEFQVETAVRGGQAKAVLVCDSASDNTKKKFRDAAAFRNMPFFIMPGSRLGASIGKPAKKVVALTGALAPRILKELQSGDGIQD